MLSVAVNAILTLVVPVVAAPPAILMVPLIGASVSPDNKTIESSEQDSEEEEPLTEDSTQFQG